MAEGISCTSILEIVAKTLVDPIFRQFSYILGYEGNIESLRRGIQNLQDKRDGIKLLVDMAKRNLEVIAPDVKTWMEEVKGLQREAQGVLEDADKVENGCLNGWCPNLKQHYLLSRKATKLTVSVAKLQEEGNKHTKLSYPEPPASMVSSTSPVGLEVFDSRISKTKDVLAELKNDQIHIIGICGLGGVGKTTMVNDVVKRVKLENLFDEVVTAVVSQNQDLMKIQDQLASMLGLQFVENSSTRDRGERLRKRLSKEGERILILLDDVWEGLSYGELGIPVQGESKNKGCKVILTSRSEHVCHKMKAQQIFRVDVLHYQEAWVLFKEKAGDCVENIEIHAIAEKVVKECGGLPLAIVTVGAALNSCEKYAWEDALQQLKASTATNIEGMEKYVYSSLRLSYNYLHTDQIKRLFLLCCLFPEDFSISVESLVRFAAGLRFLKDIQTLAATRTRVKSYLEKLKSCYLLLASDEEGSVKMHDVVRDFGLTVASDGEHAYMVKHDAKLKEWPKNDVNEVYKAISLFLDEGFQFPTGLDYPRLELLLLVTSSSVQLSRDYFGGMEELKVIDFTKMFIGFDSENMLVEAPPKTVQLLPNVRTLRLEFCTFVSDIGLIGGLPKLEILSFYGSSICVLPNEIVQLSNLKLLDLRKGRIGLIKPGILSCLTKLEELYMGDYFNNREHDEILPELNSLSSLTVLDIQLLEADQLLELNDFCFDKLTEFYIALSDRSNAGSRYSFPSNIVTLSKIDMRTIVEGNVKALMRRTENLTLRSVEGLENIVKDLDTKGFINLKMLHIYYCGDMTVGLCHEMLPSGSFGRLQEATLEGLPAMRHLWKAPFQTPCLTNLRVLKVKKCDTIKSLFPQCVVKCLVQLQELHIRNCNRLEEIVSKEGAEHENDGKIIEFPKMKYLKLRSLPSLRSFLPVADNLGSTSNSHSGIMQLLFNEATLPCLEKLEFFGFNPVGVNMVGGHVQGGSSCKLRVLEIFKCDVVRNIVGSDSVQLLHNLEELQVIDCDSVEAVFDFEGVECEEAMLGQLVSMSLGVLPKLRHIWENVPKGINILQGFQNLRTLYVSFCDSLRYLLSPSIARILVNLRKIDLAYCNKMEEVIQMEEEEDYNSETERIDKFAFPQLQYLHLRHLESLTTFCCDNRAIEFPSLDNLFIKNCPKMRSFCSGPLSTPKLERLQIEIENEIEIEIENEKWIWKGDLNSTIRHLHERSQSEDSHSKDEPVESLE